MIDPARDHRAVAIGLPPPRIEWIKGARGGMPKLRASSPTTNIIGLPRLEIAYLRLFNNEHRHVSFVKGAWREFGSVSMLRSAVSMTPKEAQRARRVGFEPLFVTSRQQLEAELSAVGIAPCFGVSRVDAGPNRVMVRDRYGAYPMRSILCANSTWRAAVDRLLDTADLVVLDLSGYTDRRAGTRYELQRVLDRVPAERLIMLADPKSKNKILEEAIADACASVGRLTECRAFTGSTLDRARRPAREDHRSGAKHHDGRARHLAQGDTSADVCGPGTLVQRAADRPRAEHSRARHFDRRCRSVAGVRFVGVAADAVGCAQRPCRSRRRDGADSE
jgi:hypothetical protein